MTLVITDVEPASLQGSLLVELIYRELVENNVSSTI